MLLLEVKNQHKTKIKVSLNLVGELNFLWFMNLFESICDALRVKSTIIVNLNITVILLEFNTKVFFCLLKIQRLNLETGSYNNFSSWHLSDAWWPVAFLPSKKRAEPLLAFCMCMSSIYVLDLSDGV